MECSSTDANFLLNWILGEGKDLEQTIQIPTPYIEKVVQHWYRNQYFSYDSSDNKLESAKKIAIRFLEAASESIESEEIKNQVQNSINNVNNVDENNDVIENSITNEENQVQTMTTRVDVSLVIRELYNCYNNIIKPNIPENEQTYYNALIDTAITSIVNNYGKTYEQIYYPTIWEPLSNSGNPTTSSDNETIGDELYIGDYLNSNLIIDDAVYQDSSPEVIQVIHNSYWKITSDSELVQIHNPIFEDNSKYIRQLLKEKYIIYNGEDTTKEEKLNAGKTYIQSKTALDNLVAMLDKTTIDDKYIKYLKRDVQEFAQDYAFDLFQVPELEATKDLDNIMPEYVPYTVWPSEYEKAEEPWTKMIFKKSGETELCAPADCEITKFGSIYKIALKTAETENESNTSSTNSDTYEYIYLMADGNTNININENTYEKGQKIGIASSGTSNGVSTISIKMQMLSYTKQKIDITTRMNVKNKTIEDITKDEKNVIYKIAKDVIYYFDLLDQDNDGKWDHGIFTFLGIINPIIGTIWSTDTSQEMDYRDQLFYQEVLALINTAFNRISSPYCSDSNLENLNYDELGATGNNHSIDENIVTRLIDLALKGSDKTKEDTILGATRYYKIWKEIGDYNKEDVEEKIKNMKLKQQISGGLFYLPNEEYKQYQEYYINNKIRSIIMQLNEQKDELNEQKGYSAGYGKYEFESISDSTSNSIPIYDIYKGTIGEKVTKKLKEIILQLGEMSFKILNTDAGEETIIKNIIVTQVDEQIEGFADENEGEQQQSPSEDATFTDSFIIQVNSNVSARIYITYKCKEEGIINYDTLELKFKIIPRL